MSAKREGPGHASTLFCISISWKHSYGHTPQRAMTVLIERLQTLRRYPSSPPTYEPCAAGCVNCLEQIATDVPPSFKKHVKALRLEVH